MSMVRDIATRLRDPHHMMSGGMVAMLMSGLGIALTIPLHLVLARLLGPQSYGQYSVVVAWAMLLVIPARFGLDDLILRFGSRYRARARHQDAAALATSALRQTARISLLLTVLALAVAGGAPALFADAQFSTRIGMTQIIFPVAALGLFASILRVEGRIAESQSLLQLARPTVLLGLIAVWVSVGFTLTSASAIWLTVAALWIVVLAVGFVQWRRGFRPCEASSLQRRHWLAIGAVLFPIAMAREAINQLDLVMVGAIAGPVEAAHFSVAFRLAGFIPFGLAAMGVVAAAPIAVAYARGDQESLSALARSAARISFVVGLGIALVLLVAGRWMLSWFGSEYVTSYPLLVVMMVGGLGNAFTGVSGYLLTMTGRQNAALGFLIAALALDMVLNFALIPLYGAMGAAIAWTVTSLIWNLCMACWIRQRMNIHSFAVG